MPLPDLSRSLAALRAGLDSACAAAGRDPRGVTLVAVGKSQPVARLSELLALGHRDLGESYLQEALPKVAALAGSTAIWHFIGPIQGNKTADVAAHFAWAHAVDRERIARRLSEQRPATLPPLNVCVQVNISGEASKSGVRPDEAGALCGIIAGLPRLRLRGLMAIPAPAAAAADPAAPFRRLHELWLDLRRRGFELDTLSAGMSDDYPLAIAHGATHVRVGTALFGPRTYP